MMATGDHRQTETNHGRGEWKPASLDRTEFDLPGFEQQEAHASALVTISRQESLSLFLRHAGEIDDISLATRAMTLSFREHAHGVPILSARLWDPNVLALHP